MTAKEPAGSQPEAAVAPDELEKLKSEAAQVGQLTCGSPPHDLRSKAKAKIKKSTMAAQANALHQALHECCRPVSTNFLSKGTRGQELASEKRRRVDFIGLLTFLHRRPLPITLQRTANFTNSDSEAMYLCKDRGWFSCVLHLSVRMRHAWYLLLDFLVSVAAPQGY